MKQRLKYSLIVLLQMIDFVEFEEIFKLGYHGGFRDDDGTPKMLRKSRKPESISLLEPNRLRNCGMFTTFFYFLVSSALADSETLVSFSGGDIYVKI